MFALLRTDGSFRSGKRVAACCRGKPSRKIELRAMYFVMRY
ncbi:hypothetical protein FH063_001487 [Azospirillum argentinense]|uniref:Uncharacterized protein n=1 Tax=Azospirillum argentinense TaxID=2970906 RepID=A0A5B0KYX6_9PROT|nr:hypothetical protein FH063_001487 [Azospirillum argentinense]